MVLELMWRVRQFNHMNVVTQRLRRYLHQVLVMGVKQHLCPLGQVPLDLDSCRPAPGIKVDE
jgi:hypothetical protein